MAAPSYRSNTQALGTASSVSVSKPSGTVEDDGLIVFLHIEGTNTITPPAGWDSEFRTVVSSTAVEVFTKVAGPSEPSSYTFSFSGSVGYQWYCVAYSGVGSIEDRDANSGSSGTSITAPSLDSSGSDRKLLYLAEGPGGLSSREISTPSGMTNRISYLGNEYQYLADETVGAGATGTRTGTRTDGGAGIYYHAHALLLVEANAAPTAPTLVAPADAGEGYLRDGLTFDWTFNDPDAGDTQSEYALVRKRVP